MAGVDTIEYFAPVAFSGPGFLGTAAPLRADLVLMLEVAMGLALLAGAVLARKRMYRWHARCQSTVVLMNLVIIILVMLPSFFGRVVPKIPEKLSKPVYAIATAHAIAGTVAEIGGLYVLLAAGTQILPNRFRLTNYRRWMRTVLALWWLVLLLGIGTYARFYTAWPALIRVN